eukprot:8202951-Pyramimonas_sp.AAC.1
MRTERRARSQSAVRQRSCGHQSTHVYAGPWFTRVWAAWGGGPPADSTLPRNALAPGVTEHHRLGGSPSPAATARIY